MSDGRVLKGTPQHKIMVSGIGLVALADLKCHMTPIEDHMAKRIIYNGVVYTRYAGRLYYNPNGTHLGKNTRTSLHRQMWLDAGREIPAGWHVHHRDHDYDHNELSNFECISPGDHARLHIKERLAGDLGKQLAEWRGSDAGRATLRDNARKMVERTPERQLSCPHCKVAFVTRHPNQKYCSDDCAEQLNRPLELVCSICSTHFRAKRNAKKQTQTCSYSCGWALRRKNASLQSNGC